MKILSAIRFFFTGQLQAKQLHPDAKLPTYGTAGAGCFDFYACGLPEYGLLIINAEKIRTGLAIDIPPGYVLEIYSRSGHGFNNDVRLSNSVGIIDSDYTGEIQVKLACDGAQAFRVKNGDRIAQGKLVRAPRVRRFVLGNIATTERGAGGFGSTGK